MPMTAEDRKKLAQDLYQDLRTSHSPDAARAIMQERHGLTSDQMDDIAPESKPKRPKPPPPPRSVLESELQTTAGLLRSVSAALRSPRQGPNEYRSLAKNVDGRAGKIEKLLDYIQKGKPNAQVP